MIRPPVLVFALAGLVLFSMTTLSGQSPPPGPDSTMREVSRAMNEGRLMDAEKILVEAVQKLESDDSTNPRLAIYLGRLAMFYEQRHQFADALALLQRALKNDRYSFGYSDTRVANDLTSIAGVYQAQGEIREAEKFFEEALKVARQNPNQNSYSIEGKVAALSNLASFYISGKRNSEAEILLQEAMQLCDSMPQLKAPGYGCSSTAASLAEVYRLEERPAESDHAESSGNELYDQITLLNKQGQTFEEKGDLEDAKGEFLRALTLIEKSGNSRSSSFLSGEFNLLGQVLAKEKEDQQAEELYVRALRMQESLADSKPPGSFQIRSFNFDYLLNFYREADRLQDIEPLIEQAIQIQEKFLGPDNSAIADTLLALATAYQQQGELSAKKDQTDSAMASYAKAKSAYEHALEIQQKNFGPDHPKSIPALTGYMGVLRNLHDVEAADKVQVRIDAILGDVRKQLPGEVNNSKATPPLSPM